MRLYALELLFCLVICPPAYAAIVTGVVTGGGAASQGGTFIKLTPPIANPHGDPNTVGNNNFQTPNLYAFDEGQDVSLSSTLQVDLRRDGGTAPLPAGVVISSHYLVFDPATQRRLIGTVEFDGEIIAIVWGAETLSASDFLANMAVNFADPQLRGKEDADTISIDESNPRQIHLSIRASSPGDSLRVLTSKAVGGDFDSDGDVDGRDFLLWQRGGSLTPLSTADLELWQGQYGGTQLAAALAVPEPNGGTLIAIALGVIARRKESARLRRAPPRG